MSSNIGRALDPAGDLRRKALGLSHYPARDPQQLAVEGLDLLLALVALRPANGAKSRGPSTIQGKLVSSQNATRHGCTANSLVLTNESGDRFQSLLQSYIDELQPTTQLEMDLV